MKKISYTVAILLSLLIVFSACDTVIVSSTPSSSESESTTESQSAAESESASSSETAVDYGEYKVFEADENTNVVVFGSDEVSFQVISTLIVRNENALLVDTKFSKTDAQNIIRYLQDSGLNLTRIFISHGDPDYYFGLEEFRAAYPGAEVGTTTEVAKHIEGTVASKLKVWAEALGNELPKNFAMPENLVDTSFGFEDLTIEIFGSNPTRITLYIPELNMLLGGGNITSGNHLFLADMSLEEDRRQWRDNLTELKGLNADIVIPGHANLVGETFGGEAIDFSIEYLQTAEDILPNIQTGEEFIAAMSEKYSNLNSPDVLSLSAGVLTGEMEWRRYVDN